MSAAAGEAVGLRQDLRSVRCHDLTVVVMFLPRPLDDASPQVKAEFGDDIFIQFVDLLKTFSEQVCTVGTRVREAAPSLVGVPYPTRPAVKAYCSVRAWVGWWVQIGLGGERSSIIFYLRNLSEHITRCAYNYSLCSSRTAVRGASWLREAVATPPSAAANVSEVGRAANPTRRTSSCAITPDTPLPPLPHRPLLCLTSDPPAPAACHICSATILRPSICPR